MKICKKRFLTLIEIMIVMFLIMLIMGVVAYNYRGALDQGKIFKTEGNIAKIENVLDLAVAQNPSLIDDIESNWKEVIARSPLVKDPAVVVKDGWGEDYEVHVEEGKIEVRSRQLDEYKRSHSSQLKN